MLIWQQSVDSGQQLEHVGAGYGVACRLGVCEGEAMQGAGV
jgi:hypothetical protein